MFGIHQVDNLKILMVNQVRTRYQAGYFSKHHVYIGKALIADVEGTRMSFRYLSRIFLGRPCRIGRGTFAALLNHH